MRKDPRMNEYIDTKLEENVHETEAYIDKMNKGVDDEGYFNKRVYHMIVYRLEKLD
jgi:ribosomal-protein-alanine N-acetyltransferase